MADDIAVTAARLEAALDALRAAFEGMPAEVFTSSAPGERSPRDLLWWAGLREDWVRRTVAAALGGRPLPAFDDRPRPAIAERADYLLTWLDQCHRPMLALLRRVPEDALDREVVLSDGAVTTPRLLLDALVSEFAKTVEHLHVRRGERAASMERG